MFKKSLNIILIVLVIAAVGFGSYYFFVLKQNPLTGTPVTIADFWPFGQGSENTDEANSFTTPEQPLLPETADELVNENGEVIPIRQLTTEPVAGFTALELADEAGVRYLDRATGHIFDVSLESNLRVRKSNTTVPKIIEAYWNSDGNRVLMRYLTNDNETIESQLGDLGESIASENDNDELQILNLTNLPTGIQVVAVSPNKEGIAYLTKGSGGIISLINFTGNNNRLVTNLDISEWLLDWPATNLLAVTTKAAATIPGYSYLLNINSGNLTKTVSGVFGLTTKYLDGDRVLYNNNPVTLTLVLETITGNSITEIPVRTLPEKCLASASDSIIYCAAPRNIPNTAYPDSWYMGLTSFNDDLWRYNLDTGELTLIANLQNQAVDIISPTLNDDESYLLFMNKKDGTLWSVALN